MENLSMFNTMIPARKAVGSLTNDLLYFNLVATAKGNQLPASLANRSGSTGFQVK